MQPFNIGDDGMIPQEEIDSTLLILDQLMLVATSDEERALIKANMLMLQHLSWCYKQIRDAAQREYTLQCMLHAEGKLPYDPDKLN